MVSQRICSVEGCGKARYCKGFCTTHYQRMNNYGRLHKALDGAAEAFVRNAANATTDECIIWPFRCSPSGYGVLHLSGVDAPVRAHREVCRIAHGDPAPGHVARHKCHNRACVNPQHLVWGTTKQNAQDCVEAGRISRGVHRYNAVLNDDLVRAIRKAEGTQLEIGRRFGVKKSLVQKVRAREVWVHVLD